MVYLYIMPDRHKALALVAALAAFAKGLCMSASAEAITAVAQLRDMSAEAYAATNAFCLTGLVATTDRKGALLYAADGSCHLWSTNVVLQTGDVVRATGYTELDFFADDPILHMTNAAVLGRAPLPEPPLLGIGDLLSGLGDYRRIRVRGFITDAFTDDIDDSYVIALFNVGGRILHTATLKAGDSLAHLRSLIDADVEITGICYPRIGGKRLFGGPILTFDSAARDIRVLSRPADDPFAAPPLRAFSRTFAESISGMKRHSVHGRVIAAWQKRNMLVGYGRNLVAKVTLADGERLPEAGTWVDAAGFPETDQFAVNLANALCRPAAGERISEEAPEEASAYRICHHPFTRRYDIDFHGHLVRLRGLVRAISRPPGEPGRITMESDGILVPVDAGTSAEALDKVEIGCTIEATGACVMESESSSPRRVVPSITGFLVVIRSPGDIRIVTYPPWWTPRRFLLALSGLVLLLAAILTWNVALRRLVERRSRQLMKSHSEKIKSDFRTDERTRIATELHDYLAQNLTAMSYQLTAARLARDDNPSAALKHLETATAMLNSSRTELRRCLWDLKSEALEEPTFELAIRRALQQVLDDTRISISFRIPRRSVNDTTAHAVLSAIRELVSNAIQHGHAKSIGVTGWRDGERLRVAVADDGVGFDPSSCRGTDDGHFGLDGIRGRLGRIGGEFSVASSPGRGTTAEISIPLGKTTALGRKKQ